MSRRNIPWPSGVPLPAPSKPSTPPATHRAAAAAPSKPLSPAPAHLHPHRQPSSAASHPLHHLEDEHDQAPYADQAPLQALGSKEDALVAVVAEAPGGKRGAEPPSADAIRAALQVGVPGPRLAACSGRAEKGRVGERDAAFGGNVRGGLLLSRAVWVAAP